MAFAALLVVAFAGCGTGEHRRVTPGIHQQVDAVVKRHGYAPADPDKLRAEARAVFQDALRARGVDPSEYELIVHIDDTVGPMCFVRDAHGHAWVLPEFDAALSRLGNQGR